MNQSKNQKEFYCISIIFIFTSLMVLAFPLLSEENTGDSIKTKSIQAVEELIANMDKEYVIKIAKENKESTYAKWFKGICKSTKALGSILEYCEKIDSEIFVFKELVPAQIPDKVWIRYFGEGKIRFGKIKEVVVVWTKKKTNLVQNFEETGQKVGYVLAAFSIAQDIYNALGSNDDKRLKAIYTTAKNVLFNYLFKKIGVSINPFISIGINVLEWGLNTFIKQSFDRHRRDWEQAYRKYMDQHYPEEYWDGLLKTTFNETGGVSRAKTKIQEALFKFWENPDVNFNDIMGKSSTLSSTRGGALAEKYKKNIVADYYNWYVKPKIIVLLRTEMMYARNEARYAAINSIKKLLNKNNEEDLKNLARAIDMAKDFKKATLSLEPENVTLKAGESMTFSVTLKIGNDSLAIANEDLEWNHSNGTFNADESMIGKTINIKATYAGKTGTAAVKVGDKTDEAIIKALAAAKEILHQMKKAVSDAQKVINDADEICSSGKTQLELAQTALPTKEFLERESPLNNYEKLKTSIMNKVDQLESLMKKSTDDYTSAGVYKSNCEKKTMEACEGAYLLRRIKDAKTSALTSAIPEPELNKNPDGIMNNVSNTAAKTEEYGNQALSDIKSVVESGKNAKTIYNSIKNAVDNYVKDLHKAKKQQDKEFNKSRNHLEKARSELAKLYGKIEKIKKTENQLKSSSIKAKSLLIPFKNNEKAVSVLKEITKCYEDFVETVKTSKGCYDSLKNRIDRVAESYMNDRIEYDSRENRENTGRLQVLVKKAYGYLVGIDQDVRNAKSLESAVQNAMKNAKKCKEKAQDFLDRIREIQKEKGETDSSESDFSTSGGETTDEGKCLFLKRAFYARIRWSDSDSAIKEAAEILERAKDCPFYEEGLRELNRLRTGEEESGFSTSGGETISEDSSSTQGIDKDYCINLENDFYAALDTGDINWAQSILNKARDCPFYSRGMDMLQSAVEAQEIENKREEENRCRKLYRELVKAAESNNLAQVRSILAKSGNCSFYDQGVKWVENAEHNQYCQNLLRNFYHAIQKGQPASAQRILENGRKAGCSFPPEANQLLQQSFELSRQREIERRQRVNQQMNNLLNLFSNVIKNMDDRRNVPSYRPPATAPHTSRPGSSASGVEGTGSVSTRNVNICIIDHNNIIDDYYDLYVNGRFIGPVRHGTGKRTCYRTMLQTGNNIIELKFVKAMGKSTALTISINNGEFKSVFTGSRSHRWSIRAPGR